MKKRFLAAAMAAVMALSVTACSGGSSAPETRLRSLRKHPRQRKRPRLKLKRRQRQKRKRQRQRQRQSPLH